MGRTTLGNAGALEAEHAALTPEKATRQSLGEIYQNITNIPDGQVGWLPFALGASKQLMRRWEPEVIYASGPPFTACCVAALLSRQQRQHKHGVPWIAEVRDRWSDDPYYPPSSWRIGVDSRLEKAVLSCSSGIVTVSEPWAKLYRQKYRKPTVAIYNGYDPTECGGAGMGSPSFPGVRIAYTGRIYPGRRDPAPLFHAIRLCSGRCKVVLEMFGGSSELVLPIAERYGVSQSVSINPHIGHRDSLRVQAAADVLLLMQWNDPREQGNVPGKLFEYLGARRPIIGLGLEHGVPAAIIRERSAGLFSNNPTEISEFLCLLARQKINIGHIPALPESAAAGLSRDDQFANLRPLLFSITGSP